MMDPDPAGRPAAESFVRAVLTIACVGGGLLMIALVVAMDRWMIG